MANLDISSASLGTDTTIRKFSSEDTRNVIYGIYPSRSAAESAVDRLKNDGFLSSDVSVLLTDSDSTKDFAEEKNTKAPEGATTGVSAGAVIGGALGWLAGIGSLAIPGVGPLIAAGPIMATLAGAGVGGAIGGITGALVGMGIPEYEAKRYEGMVKEGGVLLTVNTPNSQMTERAKNILESTGAKEISTAEDSSPNLDLAGTRTKTNPDASKPTYI